MALAKDVGGAEIAVVVGGGNLLRGARQNLLPRTTADLAGMLGTIINGLALQSHLRLAGHETKLQSALHCNRVSEPIDPARARAHLSQGQFVIFAGGTGNPLFTTDSAAALRAGEIEADLILKATRVDGVYTSDPERDPDAEIFSSLTYSRLFDRGLEIIDPSAAKICQEIEVPMVVFNLYRERAIRDVLKGKEVGTFVY